MAILIKVIFQNVNFIVLALIDGQTDKFMKVFWNKIKDIGKKAKNVAREFSHTPMEMSIMVTF